MQPRPPSRSTCLFGTVHRYPTLAASLAGFSGKWLRICLHCLMAFPLLISGCATTLHKDFLPNFIGDGRHKDSSFNNIVVSMLFHDDAKVLLVGRESGQIEIWNATEPYARRVINAHEHRASKLAFALDGQYFFSNSVFEKISKLWSVRTGELLFALPETRGPLCATNSRDLFLASQGSTFRVFDLEKKELLPGEFSSSGSIMSCAFDIASGNFAIGTASGTVEIWRFGVANGKPIPQRMRTAEAYAMGDWVLSLQFSANGSSLYSVTRTGKIDEWAVDSFEKVRAVPTPLRHVHSAAFSPDGQLLAIGGTVDRMGVGRGNIELITLRDGTSTTYHSNTNLPIVVFVQPGPSLVSAQSTLMELHEVKGQIASHAAGQ